MNVRALAALVVLALAACSDRARYEAVSPEYVAIMKVALAAQPDLATEYREYVATNPDEASVFGGFLDHRICVSQMTAGDGNDFKRDRHGVHNSPWERSQIRTPIPRNILPHHLRWESKFSYCANGVLRFGNPVIEGNEARVFIENKCSGWCGWGGQIDLKRENERWKVEKVENWWVA